MQAASDMTLGTAYRGHRGLLGIAEALSWSALAAGLPKEGWGTPGARECAETVATGDPEALHSAFSQTAAEVLQGLRAVEATENWWRALRF